jgi:hypothetical protein
MGALGSMVIAKIVRARAAETVLEQDVEFRHGY